MTKREKMIKLIGDYGTKLQILFSWQREDRQIPFPFHTKEIMMLQDEVLKIQQEMVALVSDVKPLHSRLLEIEEEL